MYLCSPKLRFGLADETLPGLGHKASPQPPKRGGGGGGRGKGDRERGERWGKEGMREGKVESVSTTTTHVGIQLLMWE